MVAIGTAVGAAAIWMWQGRLPPDEREIRTRIEGLSEDLNADAPGEAEAVMRATRLARHFTEDVVVDLGQGGQPIVGRDTLIAMAARLQLRTAAFTLELEDVNVAMLDPVSAEVTLTALIRRTAESSEVSLDAREFSLNLSNVDGQWRITRVSAIDTLR